MQKPCSRACENNKKAILDVISPYFKEYSHILEIGSGEFNFEVRHFPYAA